MPVGVVRQFLGSMLIGLSAFLVGFGPPVMTDVIGQLRLAPSDITAIVATAHPPAVTARAALTVDIDSGATLYALHPNDPLPPASTAKMMTALVVLNKAGLADPVAISETAAATEGSRMGLVAGETLTVEQLLYGLLLPSGNDAAVALAEHVAGTQAAFVAEMNRTAVELGLTASRFQNAHGLDAEGQVMSASDLLALTLVALRQPLFRTIVATPTATIAGRTLTNTNELLGVYDGIDGVKTGTTDEAKECLVVSWTRDGHRVLVVLLGSTDRYGDMRALLDHAAHNWRWHTGRLPDDALAWAVGADGRTYRLRTLATSDIFVPAWQSPLVHPVRVISPGVAMTSTLPVGELRWMLNDQTLSAAPLTTWQGP